MRAWRGRVLTGKHCLLHDRDPLFTDEFRQYGSTFFDLNRLTLLEAAFLGIAEGDKKDGHAVANALLIELMNKERDEYEVHCRADLPADATANLDAEATLKGELGDPLLLIAIGASGALVGDVTAFAKANVSLDTAAEAERRCATWLDDPPGELRRWGHVYPIAAVD